MADDMPLTDISNRFLQSYMAGQDFKRKKAQEEAAKRRVKVPGLDFEVPESEGADYQLKLMQIQALRDKARQDGIVPGMTPGRKAADQAFGREYQDFATGGAAQVDKSLGQLQQAKQELTSTPGVTGPLRGALPDWARAFTNPQAVGIKERIRGAVQNSLKATLGAQFTEKEGERIFNLAYNDRLPVEENVKRLDAAIKQIQEMAASKGSASEQFERTGTLTGWQGRQPVQGMGGQPQMGGGNARAQAAQQILSDPQATPEEKAWAAQQLGR